MNYSSLNADLEIRKFSLLYCFISTGNINLFKSWFLESKLGKWIAGDLIPWIFACYIVRRSGCTEYQKCLFECDWKRQLFLKRHKMGSGGVQGLLATLNTCEVFRTQAMPPSKTHWVSRKPNMRQSTWQFCFFLNITRLLSPL